MALNEYRIFEKLLSSADICLNGDRPWDIKVKDEKMFDRVICDGSLGLGETYMEGWWECQDIAEMISRVMSNDLESKLSTGLKLALGSKIGKAKVKKLFNPQSICQSKKDISFHYDIGNDLYEAMLDKRMTYTCAYWKDASTLDEAQEKKLDLICRKIGLEPGMRVLDIGCGWGSLMNYAAEKYGVICDGLTLSKEQAKAGQVIAESKGLDVNFILQDYREYQPKEAYDRVVSVGMIEHVGAKNYREFFKVANTFMKEDGLFLLHNIGSFETTTTTDPWINKYIFPNGEIPSLCQLSSAMEPMFNLEDLHNIGEDYDKTLVAWYKNFDKAYNSGSLEQSNMFYRMWKYYLLSCAGAFRCRHLSVWQMVLSKVGTHKLECARAS
ncbi:cyclopropane-fatty-acyl-phospholipid synthase [Vibrio maritimus]|uniref:Cyclopropane-fatty-acyl-phospholipid synthase n=1 Tax=Vibrio maritimus TaxID=990268 RepID=A0A090RMW2_9VIBR|nr:cyclopropane-fatty-acyl-phospholipid synthase [Vibrio maritimus]